MVDQFENYCKSSKINEDINWVLKFLRNRDEPGARGIMQEK